MKLTSDSLTAHLQQQLLPAYLISGDEPLLSAEAADAIRERARAAGFTERDVHFMDRGSDWDDVRAAAGNLSLFGGRRLLEIRLPTGKPGVAGGNALTALLQRADPDTLFLILTPRLEREAQSAGWVKAVESNGGWLAVWPIDVERLVPWLRARARRMNLQISDEGLELLAERTEGNLLAAQQELEKLKLQALPGPITADAILMSVSDSSRFDVFQLSEAVLTGEVARALQMLAGLRAEGVEPTLVLWAVIKAARDLWAAASGGAGVGRGWGRQAAALENGARRAARLPFKTVNVRANRADRMAKGQLAGNVWDEMALLIAELCAQPALQLPDSMVK